MSKFGIYKWACLLIVAVVVASCGVDIPKETPSSFETMIHCCPLKIVDG